MIGFTTVPSNAIASGVFVEQEAVASGLGTLILPQKIVLFGQYNSGKTPEANTPKLIADPSQAAKLYGSGSMLHLMALKTLPNCGAVPVYAMPIAPDGDAISATGKITVAGTSTSSGVHALFVAGQKLQVAVSVADAAAAIALKIAAKINSKINLPVTATVADAVVTLTAKWGGLSGNSITIEKDLDTADEGAEPDGITLSITAMASGAVNPDISAALTALGATFYTFLAIPYADSENLAALDAAFESRLAADIKKPFVAFIGDTALKSAYVDAVTPRNSPAETYVNAEASPTLPCEIAASAVAVCAKSASANPARPWKSLKLPGVRASSKPRLTYAEHNTIQAAGGGTTDPQTDGTVVIHDLVTTYKTNALGAEDDSLRYPETIANMQAKIYSLDNLFSGSPFDRAIVVDDSSPCALPYVISPKRVKAYLIRLIDELWIPSGWSKNRDDIVDSIKVEIDSGNAGRINTLLNDAMSAGLRILAVKYQWGFGSN